MTREYSEDTQKYVDEEIAKTIAARYDHVLTLLQNKRGLLDKIAATLLEKEVIEEAEFVALTKDEQKEQNPADSMTTI